MSPGHAGFAEGCAIAGAVVGADALAEAEGAADVIAGADAFVGDEVLAAMKAEIDRVEAKIKAENQAVSRCFPLDQTPGDGKCIACGQPVTERALFARAY